MKILISDPHFQPFREKKFLTQKQNLLEKIIQHFADNEEKAQKVLERMRKTIEREKISIGVINGDFAEAQATERGMCTEEDLLTISALFEKVRAQLGLAQIELNGGNHEFGYNLPLSTDTEAGMRQASLQNFLRLTGRSGLYHSFPLGRYKAILVPYLFSEERAVDFDIETEKRLFLRKMEQDLAGSAQVILFLHDPDSLDDARLLDLIRHYRKNIAFIFFGHYHSWVNLAVTRALIVIFNNPLGLPFRWLITFGVFILTKDSKIVRKVGAYFRKRRNIPGRIRELGAVLIPAPTGMVGLGGGYRVLDLEKLRVRKYR